MPDFLHLRCALCAMMRLYAPCAQHTMAQSKICFTLRAMLLMRREVPARDVADYEMLLYADRDVYAAPYATRLSAHICVYAYAAPYAMRMALRYVRCCCRRWLRILPPCRAIALRCPCAMPATAAMLIIFLPILLLRFSPFHFHLLPIFFI